MFTKKDYLSITYLMSIFTLIFFVSSAQAKAYSWGANIRSAASPVSVDIVDDQGHYLNQYSAHKNNYHTQRTYLEAIKGKRYKLRIRNNSNRRIGVVVAVDGRNILSGKKSYLRSNEKMYVLDPYETTDYKGWRTSKNKINRFYFTSAGGSYANAWGDRSAMGVIAVAVFNEKQRYYKKYRKNELSKPLAPSTRSRRGYLSDESTGTGFGNQEYSPTVNVRFTAKSTPAFRHFLKYEWRNTLCKRGVINCDRYNDNNPPNRFWPQEVNNGYAPYPPNYHNNWNDITGNWNDIVTSNNNW